MAWWLIFAALAAIGVGGWLNRRALRERLRPANLRAYFKRPVMLTRGHTTLYTALVGLAIASTILTSALNRRELNREREAQLEQITAQLVTMDRLAAVERRQRAYSRLQARLAQPSLAECNRENLQAIRACGRSDACRGLFAGFVRTVVRTDTRTGDIIPAPPTTRPDGTVPFPRPAPSSPPQIVQPPSGAEIAAVLRKVERLEREIADVRNRKPIDSGTVARVDALARDLEQGLLSITERLTGLEGVQERLRLAVCRVLPVVCR